MPVTAVLAWVLSILALVVRELPGTSALGLALLPWVALAGFPRGRDSSALTLFGLALPVLGLAAAQDVARGVAPASVASLALIGGLLIVGQAVDLRRHLNGSVVVVAVPVAGKGHWATAVSIAAAKTSEKRDRTQ